MRRWREAEKDRIPVTVSEYLKNTDNVGWTACVYELRGLNWYGLRHEALCYCLNSSDRISRERKKKKLRTLNYLLKWTFLKDSDVQETLQDLGSLSASMQTCLFLLCVSSIILRAGNSFSPVALCFNHRLSKLTDSKYVPTLKTLLLFLKNVFSFQKWLW